MNFIPYDYNSIYNYVIDELNKTSEFKDVVKDEGIMKLIISMMNYYTYFTVSSFNSIANDIFPHISMSGRVLYDFANFVGYKIKRKKSAEGYVKFYLTNPLQEDLYIPSFTKVSSEDGNIVYTTLNPVKILAGQLYSDNVYVIQGEFREIKYIATGEDYQIYYLYDDVENDNLEIYVNNEKWEIVNTFLFYKKDDKVCLVKNIQGGIYVMFSDGIFGKKPAKNDVITIKYLKTLGKDGNINEVNYIVKVIDNINENLKVKNEDLIGGGADGDSEDDIRKNIPLFLSSVNFLVTRDDYRNYLLMNNFILDAIVKAGWEIYKKEYTGNITNVFIEDAGAGLEDDNYVIVVDGDGDVNSLSFYVELIQDDYHHNKIDSVEVISCNVNNLEWVLLDFRNKDGKKVNPANVYAKIENGVLTSVSVVDGGSGYDIASNIDIYIKSNLDTEWKKVGSNDAIPVFLTVTSVSSDGTGTKKINRFSVINSSGYTYANISILQKAGANKKILFLPKIRCSTEIIPTSQYYNTIFIYVIPKSKTYKLTDTQKEFLYNYIKKKDVFFTDIKFLDISTVYVDIVDKVSFKNKNLSSKVISSIIREISEYTKNIFTPEYCKENNINIFKNFYKSDYVRNVLNLSEELEYVNVDYKVVDKLFYLVEGKENYVIRLNYSTEKLDEITLYINEDDIVVNGESFFIYDTITKRYIYNTNAVVDNRFVSFINVNETYIYNDVLNLKFNTTEDFAGKNISLRSKSKTEDLFLTKEGMIFLLHNITVKVE